MPNKTPAGKKFNIMVYMAADNSLSEECVFSIKEMQRVGVANNVSATAQFHTSAKNTLPRRFKIAGHGAANSTPGLRGATSGPNYLCDEDGKLDHEDRSNVVIYESEEEKKRTRAEKNDAKHRLKGDPECLNCKKQEGLSDYDSPTASEPNVLRDFILGAITENPGPDVCNIVVLSGHGNGAVGEFLRSNQSQSSLDIKRLGEIFPDFISSQLDRKIDILIMDSCLMSMAEVAYELKDKVDYLIGSEGFELSTGWPYHHLMNEINEAGKNNVDAETLAGNLVKKYIEYYLDYDLAAVSVDQALLDLNKSDDLAMGVRKLADALLGAIGKDRILDVIILAHWRAQSYNADQYVDLWDFCSQLAQYRTNGEIDDTCRNLQDLIEKDFVIQHGYSGAAFQHSHGVSIYFPWAADCQFIEDFKDLNNYNRLAFAKVTRWGELIREYLCRSRREIYNCREHEIKNDDLKVYIPTDEYRTNIRMNDPINKGGSGATGRVRNPPVGFYRELCGKFPVEE